MGGSGRGSASAVQWSMADDRVLEEAVMCARMGLFVHWCQDVASYVRNILCLLLHLGSWIYPISCGNDTHHSLSLEGQGRTSASDESY